MKKILSLAAIAVMAATGCASQSERAADTSLIPNDRQQRDWICDLIEDDEDTTIAYPFTIADALIAYSEVGDSIADDVRNIINLYNGALVIYSMRDLYEAAVLFETPVDFDGLTLTPDYFSDQKTLNTAQCYVDSCALFLKDPLSEDVYNPFEGEDDLWYVISDYFKSHTFNGMTDGEEFFAYIDDKQWVPDLDEIAKMPPHTADLDELKSRIADTADPNARLVLASQYVRLGGDLDVLVDAIEQTPYSPALYKAWLFWRCGYQNRHGASRFSDIPNDIYNYMRKYIALKILRHLADNPDDRGALTLLSCLYEEKQFSRFESTQEGSLVPGNSFLVEAWRLNWYGGDQDE